MAEGQENLLPELPFYPPIVILSWNIHGAADGIAEPRKLLVPRVVDNVNPDVLLLQETRTNILIESIMQQHQQLRTYEIYEPGNPGDENEARVVYDSEIFEPTNEQVNLDALVTHVYPPDENPPIPLDEVITIFNERVAVVQLRHKATGQVFIFMSFHNKYIGFTDDKRRFLARMLCRCMSANMAPDDTLVVAGADFNTREFEHDQAHKPAYTLTLRRQNRTRDDFVARNHTITVQGHVSVLNIFEGGDDQFNPVWEDLNQHMNMEENNSYTQDQFKDSLDHDPLVYELTLFE